MQQQVLIKRIREWPLSEVSDHPGDSGLAQADIRQC